MPDTNIVGYTFKADTYCPDCIVDVVIHDIDKQATFGGAVNLDHETEEDTLDRLARDWYGVDRDDEYSFDTDVFPKPFFKYGTQYACGACM